jgi:hypothetical protein
MTIDIEELQESPNLLDILIQMEDVLDSMDLYVFKNWLKGEVVEGPGIRRYWLDMTLRYKHAEMPDPRGGLRLLKHGIRVDFEKARYENEKEAAGAPIKDDADDKDMVWLVRISLPRRLVVQMNAATHDFYDEEVDIEHVEDAQDSGMDDESAYHEDEQDGGGGDPSQEMAPPSPEGEEPKL